jgi:hypothetical protein
MTGGRALTGALNDFAGALATNVARCAAGRPKAEPAADTGQRRAVRAALISITL